MKKNKLNRHSIISGVLLNLTMTTLFAFFIILGNEYTSRNAEIQEDSYRTHFQSRLILKSINGLDHSRYYLLKAPHENDPAYVWEAEDQHLAAHSNFKILLSEQFQNRSHLSSQFSIDFEKISPLFVKISEKHNPLSDKPAITLLIKNISELIEILFQEESALWKEESIKFNRFAQMKKKNLLTFYSLTVFFVLIQIGLIYFTIVRYRLNRKINQQHEQLVLQTRLSTLGMMSAELAHEINSPLMVIDGRLKIVHNDLKAPDIEREKLIKNLEVIKRNSGRIQSIIKSFKTLSKSGNNDPFELYEISEIFEEVNELVNPKLNEEKIQFIMEDCTGNMMIEVRKIQIIQVLTNLVNNSIDAIKQSSDRWIKITATLLPDSFVITIIDSGKGIPAASSEHIFEPFYSTKTSVEGTGLGLSISKKIMKEHGGDLLYQADSPNTQFKLVFNNKKACV